MKIKIDVVKTYRIRKGNHYEFRRTLKGAFSKLAWWMIFEKYSASGEYKAPSGKECECWYEEGAERYDECELHDRYYGYYGLASIAGFYYFSAVINSSFSGDRPILWVEI